MRIKEKTLSLVVKELELENKLLKEIIKLKKKILYAYLF
jgi:hypothetical protein